MIKIFTDGACYPRNPGVGAWCSITLWNDKELLCKGFDYSTTSNRMESLAVVETLEKILPVKSDEEIFVITDSMYSVHGIRGWPRWQWKKKLPNKDIWERYWNLRKKYKVSIHSTWVKGHTGNPYNEECDKIAENFAKEKYNELVIKNKTG